MITYSALEKCKTTRKKYLEWLVSIGFDRPELIAFGFDSDEIANEKRRRFGTSKSPFNTSVNSNWHSLIAQKDDYIKLIESGLVYEPFFKINPFETTLQIQHLRQLAFPPSLSLQAISGAIKDKKSKQDTFTCKSCGGLNYRPDINPRETRRKHRSCNCYHCGEHHDKYFFFNHEKNAA